MIFFTINDLKGRRFLYFLSLIFSLDNSVFFLIAHDNLVNVFF